MNKKKIISLTVLALTLALALTVLVACNSFKWSSVSGGDASKTVYSNGGYYVRQGDYVYFINGFVGDTADNEWGDPLKQSIMRAKLVDGAVDNSTAQVVVPKSIYNKSTKGGFAVYGNWIYYATPNNEKTKSGTASTTHTDFMRTSLNGTITQRLATINSRESEFLFTPTRILYRTDTATVYYFDFSGVKETKSMKNASGVTSGTLIQNATSILWSYAPSWTPGQGPVASDYVFYTEKLTGDNSYEFYNNLYAISYDGSTKILLATNTSYFDVNENPEKEYLNNPEKVFNFTLSNLHVDSNDAVTLYYTKAVNTGGTSTSRGLFCNTFSLSAAFNPKADKNLTTKAVDTYYPLGYEGGAIIVSDSSLYLVDGSKSGTEDNYSKIAIGRSVTVQSIHGGYIYYTDSSSDKVYRINYDADKDSPNEDVVMNEALKTDWLSLEFDGDMLYFFATSDYSYVHYINLSAYSDSEDYKSTFIGKMTQEDADAKKAAEEAEEE